MKSLLNIKGMKIGEGKLQLRGNIVIYNQVKSRGDTLKKKNKHNLIHNPISLCGTCHIPGLPPEQSGDHVNAHALTVRGRIQPGRRGVADIKRGNRPVCL